jgi:hypothetical protein
MELPVRNEEVGIFHITDKVTVSKDVQLQMVLTKLEPLLMANGGSGPAERVCVLWYASSTTASLSMRDQRTARKMPLGS